MVRLDELRNILNGMLNDADDVITKKWLKTVHPADFCLLMRDYSKNIQKKLFTMLPNEDFRQEVLSFAPAEFKNTLFSFVNDEYKSSYLEEMSPDDVVDLFQNLDDEQTKKLLKEIDPSTAEELRDLRKHQSGTSGALMTPDFLQVRPQDKIQNVVKELASNSDLESIDTGFVLTEFGRILGKFSVKELLVHKGNPFIIQFVNEHVISVQDTDSEEIAYNVMTRHGLDILPVVDDAGKMLGIITADDMLDVAKNISDQDFYQMVGTSGDPTSRSPFFRAIHRMPWLFTTLIGGFVSALILQFFQMELASFSVLIFFMPFTISMAGNVGVQSATIIVRELVSHDQTEYKLKKDVVKEMFTGMVSAVIFCILTTLILWGFGYFSGIDTTILAPTIGFSLMCSMAFAGIIGANIPIMFTRLNIDPAISSGPIITMTMDILGLGIYLSVSSAIFTMNGLATFHF